MLRQKGPDDLPVLPVQNGTGGVQQRAARLDIPGLVAENLQLQPGQRLGLGQVLIPNIRLFSNDAQAAAGHVDQNPVHGADPLRNRLPGILQPGVDAGQAEAGRPFFQKGQLMPVYVAGIKPPLVAHIDGGGKAFSPGRGAAV